MAFIRTRNAESHDFRAAIESHMQQLDSKIALTAKMAKPIDHNRCNKPTTIPNVPVVPPITLNERPPANQYNSLDVKVINPL
jgi:hypothetical protein